MSARQRSLLDQVNLRQGTGTSSASASRANSSSNFTSASPKTKHKKGRSQSISSSTLLTRSSLNEGKGEVVKLEGRRNRTQTRERRGSIRLGAEENTELWNILQRELLIKKWVEETLGITLPDNSNATLFPSFSDGVLLCRLMKTIYSRSIPKINKSPEKNIKLIQNNVQFFLEAANEFGVPFASLFTWEQFLKLWEKVDEAEKNTSTQQGTEQEAKCIGRGEEYVKLLETLESLAGIVATQSDAKKKQISRLIRRVTTFAFDPQVIKSIQEEQEAVLKRKEKEKQKERTLELKKRLTPEMISRAAVRIQTTWRMFICRRRYRRRIRQEMFRTKVALEIYNTELVYINSLRNLCKVFLEPLRKAEAEGKPIINKEQIKLLFGEIESILGFNSQLLTLLEPRVKAWNKHSCLGDVFLMITEFMKMYTQYVKDYDASVSLQIELSKVPRFSAFLKVLHVIEAEERSILEGRPLGAFLIMPVQRIPRYGLLLKELSSHTAADHADHLQLRKAYEKMKEIATYVNNRKKESDNLAKVFEIQSNFVGKENLAVPHRRFVREGPIVLVEGKKVRYAYLFNDLVVLTSEASSSSLIARRSSQKLKEISKGSSPKKWSKGAKKVTNMVYLKSVKMKVFIDAEENPGIELIEDNGGLSTSIKFACTIAEETDEWKNDLQKMIRELANSSDSLQLSESPVNEKPKEETEEKKHISKIATETLRDGINLFSQLLKSEDREKENDWSDPGKEGNRPNFLGRVLSARFGRKDPLLVNARSRTTENIPSSRSDKETNDKDVEQDSEKEKAIELEKDTSQGEKEKCKGETANRISLRFADKPLGAHLYKSVRISSPKKSGGGGEG